MDLLLGQEDVPLDALIFITGRDQDSLSLEFVDQPAELLDLRHVGLLVDGRVQINRVAEVNPLADGGDGGVEDPFRDG